MIAEKSVDKIKKIIEHLENGGVIVYPTETAYAIGCDATNQKAVDLVFKLKKRAKSKTLPLIAGSLAMVKRYCKMSAMEERLAKRYWPVALTILLSVARCHSREGGNPAALAKGIVSKDGTAAVRVSLHPIARIMSRWLDRPLVSTSANLHGQGECYSINDAKKSFLKCHPERSSKGEAERSIAFLDGGKLKKRLPSTIVKIIDGKIKILRQGELKLC